jgi:hypothetical protein
MQLLSTVGMVQLAFTLAVVSRVGHVGCCATAVGTMQQTSMKNNAGTARRDSQGNLQGAIPKPPLNPAVLNPVL